MSIDKIRAQMISDICKAVAQSGIDLSMVPQPDQEKLVTHIADKLMITMDSLLEDSAAELTTQAAGTETEDQAAETPNENTETELWQGRPFMSLVERYTITNERLKIVRGLLSRHVENYELIRIQDLDFKQGVTERIVGVGDLTIRGHDASDPQIILRNIPEPEKVYEILRKAWLEARKRHGLQFREYM